MKPLTRKEIFMDAIGKGQSPGIEPLTREEQLLAQHAEREAGGGGGENTVYFKPNQMSRDEIIAMAKNPGGSYVYVQESIVKIGEETLYFPRFYKVTGWGISKDSEGYIHLKWYYEDSSYASVQIGETTALEMLDFWSAMVGGSGT